MAAINFQNLVTRVTTESSIRKIERIDPNKFSKSVLQISDQQSRDKNYEKSIEYLRTYIASLQAKLNSLIEELNTTYELFLTNALTRRADTKDTAKDLNKIKNAGQDGCLVTDPSRVDPYSVRITPYSKNVYNYNYNPLYASRSLDLSNYSDLSKDNTTAIARTYYTDTQQLHHELGASAFGTLQYLWGWDLDRINASYATTKESYIDEGGTLHVPPGDPRAFYNGDRTKPIPGVIEDSNLRFANPGDDPYKLQVNVTALQPNRSVFGPNDSESKRESIISLDTTDPSNAMAGWVTKYAHSSSKFDFAESGSTRVNIVGTGDPGLDPKFEGRNQWGVDYNTRHEGRATLNFGNAYTYTAYEVYHDDGTTLRDPSNAAPVPVELRDTHSSYAFDPELVMATFDNVASGASSLAGTGLQVNSGNAALLKSGADTYLDKPSKGYYQTIQKVDGTAYGTVPDPSNPSATIPNGVLSVGYVNSGGVNNGSSVTIGTPVYDLNEFDSVNTSSVNYYYIEGSLHGPGCIHPAVNVLMNPNPPGSGFPLPSISGRDVWTSDGTLGNFNPGGPDYLDMRHLKTNLPGTTNTSLNYIYQNQYADGNSNLSEWLVDNIFMKARGWSAGEMISPPMDLTNYNKAFLQFSDRVVTDNTVDRSEVWYCTDYNDATGIGTWKLLSKQGYTESWRDNNIEIPIDCMTNAEKSNVRVMFLFDTQTSSNNKSLDGWNIDKVNVVGDKKIETDFYYYRQDIDSFFVEGDGSTVTPPTTVYGALSPLSDQGFSANITASGNNFSNTTITNPGVTPTTITPSFVADAHDPGAPLLPLDISTSGNSFTIEADAAYANIPPDPSVSGDFESEFTGPVFDLSTSSSATLTFTHEGSGLNLLPYANIRKVEYTQDGTNWYPLANYNFTSIAPGTTETLTIPGGSATTQIRFSGGTGLIDDNQAGDYWNVSDVEITTVPNAGTPIVRKEEAVSGPYTVPAGAVMTFDSVGTNPAGIGASDVKRQLYYSNDGGATYNLLSSFPSGTSPVSAPIPAGNIRLKFVTEISVPSGDTAAAQANLWRINNFNIQVPSADGYNVLEKNNTNRPNISFDPRRTNIEGQYTVNNDRVQIFSSDYVSFANTLLTYIEQDPAIYNQSKLDTFAIWNGKVEEYPAEIYDIDEGRKKANSSVFLTDSLLRKYSHDTSTGPITGMYMDDALAINYGYITKTPSSVPPVITASKINENDTGWVNYDPATNWFPYIPGTKYDEGGSYKNMSIWGKKSFHINGAPPATYNINMVADNDAYLYVNGYLVPPNNWVTWHNSTYQTWYNTTYTTWYNNYRTWYNANVKPWNGGIDMDAIIPFDSSINYASFPPVMGFDLHSPNYSNPPAAPNPIPNPPIPPTPPASPNLGPNWITDTTSGQNYNIAPYLKGSSDLETGGFNTIAFKASEDFGGERIIVNDNTGTYGLSTNSTWAVKVQPGGYDGTPQYYTTGGAIVDPMSRTLDSGDIIELFKTEVPERHSLSLNFSNVDENNVGILSEIKEIEVTIRGESIVQTYGTSTFNSNVRTEDGKMITQLMSGYINGVKQVGLDNAQRIEPPTAAAPANELNYMTDVNGKALVNLFINDTKDIVNDSTPLIKVRYLEDTDQNGRIEGAEATTYKEKYIGMQDLRSNTANNSRSEIADTAVAGVSNRYEKIGNNIRSDVDAAAADALYSNYLTVGKGRSGGSEKKSEDVNPLTSKLKSILDGTEYQELLKFGLLDNIYLAATSSTQRGDQITGKLILDWDWRRRRVAVTQGSFSAIYKA